ncbi:50S ribosomal protein L23 [Candidatus Uhrbacteria bacterium]|nr:50S ribosomal protein L23 [Candidatus Uhrbacteria bacterium]
MALFDRKKTVSTDTAEEPKKVKVKKASTKKKTTEASIETSKVVKGDVAKIALHAHSLLSPRVSEKAAILASKGVFVFNVPVSVNKVEVRKAVEAIYGVNVVSVNTVRGEGKPMNRGRRAGSRNRWKKALVQLKPGQKIDLYAGV